MAVLTEVPDLRTQPVRDIIYEHLRKAILQGELKTDSYFTDVALAEEFGVSRTPVREAVQKLEADGLIERIPMRGNRVRGLAPHELAHSFSIRKALETLAMRYAALRVTEAELAELEDLVSKAEQAIAGLSSEACLDVVFPVVKRFNAVIFKAARSEHLEALIWEEREALDRYRVMRIVLPNRTAMSIERRRQLLGALRDRDPERAAAIWTTHLDESFAIWREKSGHAEELKDFVFF